MNDDWPPDWLLAPPMPDDDRRPFAMGGRTQGEFRLRSAREEYAKWRERVEATQLPVTVESADRFLIADALAGRDPETLSFGGAPNAIAVLGGLAAEELRDETLGLGIWVRNRVLWRNRALTPVGQTESEVHSTSHQILDATRMIALRDHAEWVATATWSVDRIRYGGRPPTAGAPVNKRDIGLLPTSVDGAVEWLLREIPRQLLVELGALDENDLLSTHFGLALHIRNELLWTNPELVRSTGAFEPDGASAVLVKRLWNAVRSDEGLARDIIGVREQRPTTSAVAPAPARAQRPRRTSMLPADPTPMALPTAAGGPPNSDVANAVVLAAVYGMALSPQLELAIAGEVDERGDLETYDALLSLYELRSAMASEGDDAEDEAVTSDVDRLRRTFEWIGESETPDEYAAVVKFVDSQERAAWVADFVGDRGSHRFLGPFLTPQEADAAIRAEGFRRLSEITEDAIRRMEATT